MTATPTTHPSPDELAAFLRGDMEPAALDEVAQHVAECAECCAALRKIPDDTLVQRVRRAAGHPETPRGETLAALAGTRQSSATPGLPPELADHPKYRIIELLGAGGMGVVYKAEHKIMERTVALKVINRELLTSATAVERFAKEVRAAARLSHPNIVTAHDAEHAGGVHFLVMEFVEGINLSRLVEKKGQLAISHACLFTRQAALGLQHAHEQGMIHRDIKPHNLMATRKGQVKILDFGLARFASEQSHPVTTITSETANTAPTQGGLTAVGAVLGTPDYLAPEQARSSRDIDFRADLYSLGCTLYYLLTGRPPFQSATAIQKLFLHCEAEPDPIEEQRREVPAELAAVVRRLMAKKPEDRFQSAGEAAAALLPFSKSGSGSEVPLAIPLPSPPVAEAVQTPLYTAQETMPGVPAREPLAPTIDEPPPRRKPERLPVKPSELATRRTKPKSGKRRSRSARRPWVALAVLGIGLVTLAALLIVYFDKPAPPPGKPRILFVLPQRGFYYPDYLPVRQRLEEQGAEVIVAAPFKEVALPAFEFRGQPPVKPDVILHEAKASDYDAVIVCGGPGSVMEYARPGPGARDLGDLLREMLKQEKPIAALCMGPAALAHADLLKGKNATAYSKDKIQDMLREGGAIVQPDRAVVVDGLIITARDADAGKEFADAVLKAIRR